MMEGAAMVSVSTGAVKALLSKLNLMMEEQKLKDSEKKEVESLCGELGSTNAILSASAMMGAPDLQVTEFMRQVREASYDAEDCVDHFLHQPAGRSKSRSFHLPGKSSSRNRHSFAEQICQLKDRLKEANERRTRYGVSVDSVVASDARGSAADLGPIDATSAIDPWLIAMQNTTPVATDIPTEELVGRLRSSPQEAENHTKAAFIVGIAGIGKTTLATQVYRKLQEEDFRCRAFVYVGHSPSVTTVLAEIISQVGGRRDGGAEDDDDELQAINQLRGLLKDKRYLIIIDDIWSISAWKAISCALPQNNHGSRIIATTRIFDVARSSCSHPSDLIYPMKPLDDPNSLRLFHMRVFGSEKENDDCPEGCRELHHRILKICDGLPSNILVVASLLARTAAPERWEMVHGSALSALEKQRHHPLQSMSKILHLSYTNLPLAAKSCLLYISVFPKNYVVNRDRLIWRWIAEGFIPSTSRAWETGMSYFNELINRSLIQPVFADDGDDDDPLACTVQGAIHDFIVSESRAENFVTFDEELKSRPRDVVRRLTLNYTMQEESGAKLELDLGSINLSRARSLTVLGSAQQMPNLANFQLLRVLDLEDADKLENSNLEDIGKLFNLKYLGLAGQRVTELPKSIGELQELETLEMRRTEVRKLPAAVSQMQKLLRIQAKALDDIPGGVGKMQDLQEVSTVSVNSDHALNFVEGLFKQQRKVIRVLGMKWCFRDEEQKAEKFISCLNEASRSNSLCSLSIYCDEACSLDFLVDKSWGLPYLLQKLVMESSNYFFRRIPDSLARCQGLSYLEIGIDLDGEKVLINIASLHCLTILKLSARGKPSLVIAQGFRKLKVFWLQRCDYWEDKGVAVKFETGAMPLLRKLCLHFKVLYQKQHKDNLFVSGVQHLPPLNQVNVKIDCGGAKLADVESAEETIRKYMRAQRIKFFQMMRDNEEKMNRDGGGEQQ